MKHTILVEEATWIVTGYYFNQAGEALETTGKFVFDHGPDEWHVHSEYSVPAVNYRISNETYFEPVKPGATQTRWHVKGNMVFGTARGLYLFRGNSTVINAFNEDGTVKSVEICTQMDPGTYTATGQVYVPSAQFSGWNLNCKRQ